MNTKIWYKRYVNGDIVKIDNYFKSTKTLIISDVFEFKYPKFNIKEKDFKELYKPISKLEALFEYKKYSER